MTLDLASERVEVDADPYALYELSLREGWGDGLPLLPPTAERVEQLLAGTPLPPDRVIAARMDPSGGTATVEKIAVNAVMAGCAPEHLPFVIAAVEAICRPAFNLYGVSTTTGSAFPMLIVNGPSRDRVGIDYGHGCMGGATGRGSRTIGRAVSLCMRNVGGQRAGSTTKTCLGQPARHGLCFGEWEERSPWPSVAEQLGFSKADDVVHAFAGMGTVPLCDINHDDIRDVARLVAQSMAYPAANKMLASGKTTMGISQAVLLVNPDWATRLGREFPEIGDLEAFLWEHAWQPLGLWPESTRHLFAPRADAAGHVRLNARPEQFVIVVCGGPVSLHAVYLPSWGETELQSQRVLHGPETGS